MQERYVAEIINEEDVYEVAKKESKIIIQEVANGNLPLCDLSLPDFPLPEEVSMGNFVMSVRLKKLEEEMSDSLRRVFVVKDDQKIIGKGCLRFVPNQKRAVLYSFNISSESRGCAAGLVLLKACFDEIINYEKSSGSDITTVRVGRYAKSEVKKPFIKNLMRMVNLAIPNAVTDEVDNWKGENVCYYNFPKNIAKDLLDELGSKYSMMSL